MTSKTLQLIEDRAIDLEVNTDMTANQVLTVVCGEFGIDYATLETELAPINAFDIEGVLGWLEACLES